MSSVVIDYKIFGDDMQFVEIALDPAETVIAEAGVMMYMESGITYESKMGDGSKPSTGFFDALVSAGKRVITGESLFMTHFTNASAAPQHVAFAAPYPGKIIAIDLDQTHGELICQKNSFLAAVKGTEISIAFNKKIGAGLFGGEGFILQRLRGDGMVFIHAGGTIIEKYLMNNERLLVDTGCIVAFESHIDYDIQQAGNLKSMIFGGEGLFLATLQGTGRVWLQSLPFSRLADRILQNAPSQGGSQTDEGSVIRGLTRLMGK